MTENELHEQRMARALQAIDRLQGRLAAVEGASREPIAVVGVGCRFPGGADSADAFWRLLDEGRDAVGLVPPDRWDADALYDADPAAPGRIVTREGGFVPGPELFDAGFFGIAPKEAASLDPQQRLLMEVSWEAMEDAGMVPQAYHGRPVGVFVGISSHDYSHRLLLQPPELIDAYLATGNAHSVAAGRLSYTHGFTGPSLVVDTACSSSLAAVHLACQSLRTGESEVALVGGVNRILSPAFSMNFSRARMLAPDGRCKTFSRHADGFGRAEGCGVVVLKRLADAQRSGDRILAVVRGSAVNQDGRSGGLTVPNGPAQQTVIRQALKAAGLTPSQVDYVEAHGTGTELGDPIEVGALAAVFGERPRQRPLHIGSVKTNVGHLEAAAGICGLIKVVLSLHRERLPAHLHAQDLSPHIDWTAWPVEVTRQARAWPAGAAPRVAGVSSFGFSGTNAHVVLEGAPPVLPSADTLASAGSPSFMGGTIVPASPADVLVLSARDAGALRDLALSHAALLDAQPVWRDHCWSARHLRTAFSERLAVVAGSAAEASCQLRAWAGACAAQGSAPTASGVRGVHRGRAGLGGSAASNTGDHGHAGVLLKDAVSAEQLATAYVNGLTMPWPERSCRRVPLPSYPFQRERHWIDMPLHQPPPAASRGEAHPLLGHRLRVAGDRTPRFEARLDRHTQPGLAYLSDHTVFDHVVLPAAGFMEMALASAADVGAGRPFAAITINGIEFRQALLLDAPRLAQLSVRAPANGADATTHEIEIHSAAADDHESPWVLHAAGRVERCEATSTSAPHDLAALQAQCPTPVDVAACHARLQAQGVGYGPRFQALASLSVGPGQVLSRLQLPHSLLPEAGRYLLHPVLLDAALQGIGALFTDQAGANGRAYLPAAVQQLTLHRAVPHACWCHVRARLSGAGVSADLLLIDDQGQELVSLRGLTLLPASMGRVVEHERTADWLHVLSWVAAPLPGEQQPPLPEVKELLAEVAPSFGEALARDDAQAYLALLPQLEDLAQRHAHAALTELARSGQPVRPDRARLHARVQQLAALAPADNTLERARARHAELRAAHPQAITELSLLGRCAERLADVLCGRVDPVTVLFAGGDASELLSLYSDSPGARVANELAAQIAQQLAVSRKAGRPLRVLEIGAGTGGTTAHLLPQLGHADYLFTDISPTLLAAAEQRFGNQLSYRRLDIERDPASQGFEAGAYDLVVAANVLHATTDLRATLTHVASLIAPGGRLLLLEVTQAMGWLDLIFGLMDGWWRFTDQALRTDHPLLTAAHWTALLNDMGLQDAAQATPRGGLDAELAQGVIVAAKAIEADADQQGSSRRVLVLTGSSTPLTEILADRHGARIVLLPTMASASVAAFQDLLQAENTAGRPPAELLWLAPDHEDGAAGLLHLVQALGAQTHAPSHASVRLSVISEGATSAGGDMPGPRQAVAWGLARVVALERPDLRCRRIDLDPVASPSDQAEALWRELTAAPGRGGEPTVAWRQGQRLAARLARAAAPAKLPTNEPWQLVLPTRGTPDDLRIEAMTRRAPAPGEVEIRVQAAGLNLIDVLDVLGVLPFERGWMGVECAGEVVAVGEGVHGLAPGDPVMALAPGSFRQFVTVDARWVTAQPAGWNRHEAATAPACYLTAWHALAEVAGLSAGERVLVHAAAGGTGWAAVSVAQHLGARVHATASPGKWAALEARGVEQVMNSRTLDFRDQLLARTGSEAGEVAGVDVVLNSLSGDYIATSLACLKPGGRFIEIGKRGIWSAEEVRALRPDVRYHCVDLLALARREPAHIQALFDTLQPKLATRELAPLPRRVFPATRAAEAVRCMQRAAHIGKIVLDTELAPPRVRADATYLITGGLGGLGLRTAEWLVKQGARHLVLVGRRARAADLPTSLRVGALQVEVIAADVSDKAQLATVLDRISEGMPPLRGVFHAAGVLDDSVLQHTPWSRIEQALAPKHRGAWHLHELTGACPLDWFVLYSSAAALLGSPGQGAHVAANSGMDALAVHRRALGLPALSIQWGPWSDIGAAANDRTTAAMQARGIGSISPAAGIAVMDELLARPGLAQVGVVPIHWPAFGAFGAAQDPFFTAFHGQMRPDDATAPRTDVAWAAPPRSDGAAGGGLQQELAALPPAQRHAALVRRLQAEVAAVLGQGVTQRPDPALGFFDMGMDSLMAVELRNRLARLSGVTLSAAGIFEYPTINELAGHLLSLIAPASDHREAAGTSSPVQVSTPAVVVDQSTSLSPATPSPVPTELVPASTEALDAAVAAELAALDALLTKP